MGLWVPPKVSRELAENTRQFSATLDAVAVRDKMMAVAGLLDEANYHVRQLDERLEVVRAPDTVPAGTTLKPGYYAVIRWNEGAPPTVINLQGPDGEFVDLDGHIEAVVAMLRRNNFRDPQVRRRFEEQERAQEAAMERQEETDRQERREELRDRMNAATRTSVSMSSEQPWSQNVSGKQRPRKWRSGDIGRDRWR